MGQSITPKEKYRLNANDYDSKKIHITTVKHLNHF